MITVFTPTYNRAYILPRLYQSLIEQTNQEFEWIIVDDGSTDNTEDIVQSWIKENKITIRYFKQENQGKMMAHNKGVEEAIGELFVCVDSDDYLTENAVEIITKKWNELRIINDCIGIMGAKFIKIGQPTGTKMPENINFSTLYDISAKYKYKGDTILIFKTSVIKRYMFPKIEGEKFIPEGYLYDRINQEGRMAIIQDCIYICEYLNDGYTKNAVELIKNNPKGYILAAEQRLKISNDIKQKVNACARIVLGNWLSNQKGYIRNSNHKLLMLISIPFAYYIFLKKYKNLK